VSHWQSAEPVKGWPVRTGLPTASAISFCESSAQASAGPAAATGRLLAPVAIDGGVSALPQPTIETAEMNTPQASRPHADKKWSPRII
jgi:hypothetical protein